jgi:hypothetical protein
MAVERGLTKALSTDNSELTEDETLLHFVSCIMTNLNLVVTFVDADLEEEYDD